jgi:hypothetical protein
MIGSSMSLGIGFIYGVPCDIDFLSSHDVGLGDGLDELSDGEVRLGHCLLGFSSEWDSWDVFDLMEIELEANLDFLDFYVKQGNARFVKLWEFLIRSLRKGSKKKVVERSLWGSMLIKLELSIVYSYYRLLVGVGKRGGKRGGWR